MIEKQQPLRLPSKIYGPNNLPENWGGKHNNRRVGPGRDKFHIDPVKAVCQGCGQLMYIYKLKDEDVGVHIHKCKR